MNKLLEGKTKTGRVMVRVSVAYAKCGRRLTRLKLQYTGERFCGECIRRVA